MKKAVWFLLMSLFCIGCAEKDPLKDAAPDDIVGTWEANVDHGVQGTDRFYFDIESDGSFIFYDFAGDTYDKGGECYLSDYGIFHYLGEGEYQLGNEIVHMSRSKNKLHVSMGGNESVWKKTSKRASDFQPECGF